MDESKRDELGREWHAMPNDLIGGWCVMDRPELPSTPGRQSVAEFATEALARHIAGLHNEWLKTV